MRISDWSSDVCSSDLDPRITAFSALIANDGSYVPAEIDAEKDVALLQYTGGTTGRPKGAKLTHQNLSATARQVNMLDPGNVVEDRMLGVLPFFHVFANRSEEHTSELQSLMRSSYAVFCLKKKNNKQIT